MADVNFTPKTWKDGSSGGTPITAAELNRMEKGIEDCATACNDLGDSISPTRVELSPNTNLANYSAYTDLSYMVAGLVFLQGAIVLSTDTDFTSNELRLFTLPEAARPSKYRTLSRQLFCVCGSTGMVRMRGIRIDPDGNVNFINSSSGEGTNDVRIFLIPGICFSLT